VTKPAGEPELARGEMPFLDHLEELRWRLIKCLVALMVGIGIGYGLVTHVDVIAFLKQPIDPYLPDAHKLLFTSPMEPFGIALKLAVSIGVVIALPVILFQVWSFLRPALYRRERRVVLPIVFSGAFLFLGGAAIGFYVVMPLAIPVLLGFATQSLQPMITAETYFSLTLAVVLAFGAVFEIPLIMYGLIQMRILSAAFLKKHRRNFILVNGIASAVLTPGDLIVLTLIVMIPVQLFYELSILMAVAVERRRRREEAAERDAADDAAGVAAAGEA